MTDTSTEAVGSAVTLIRIEFHASSVERKWADLMLALAAERDALAARVKELEAERGKLIENALQHYKSPNPNNCRFDLAMHAITEQRNGRKAADALWQEIDAERKQLKAMVGVIGQLEWQFPKHHKTTEFASTIFGDYSVWEIDGSGYLRLPREAAGTCIGEGIDAAKAAAQADFERRLSSCHEEVPQDAIAKAVAEERERCAKIAEDDAKEMWRISKLQNNDDQKSRCHARAKTGERIAAAIRAGEGE